MQDKGNGSDNLIVESYQLSPRIKDKETFKSNDNTLDNKEHRSENSLYRQTSNFNREAGDIQRSMSTVSKENMRMIKEMQMTGKFHNDDEPTMSEK